MSVDILIWDSEEPAPEYVGITLYWRQFAPKNSERAISIPTYIEENADEIKARYLAWVYNLGESKIGDSNTTEFLKIREDLSYWWMTPLAEKSNYAQSPQITDAIRLVAFEIWSRDREITSISVKSNNASLVDCISRYCKKLGIITLNQFKTKEKLPQSTKQVLRRFVPEPIKAFIWLFRFCIQRRSMRGIGLHNWKNSLASTTFFSYLLHLEVLPNKPLEFASNYWGSLPRQLEMKGVETNWLHIYIKSPSIPNPKAAADLIRAFNDSKESGQSHVLLDSFLSRRVILKSILNWMQLGKKLRDIEKVLSRVPCGNLDLWPLFGREYKKSSNGIKLMENMVTLNLLEEACRELPKQQEGIYLFEQQPWEIALISLWRNNSHKEIIGAQHSTVLFWDLRYFNDSRVYLSESKTRLPIADKVAVNGPAAMRTIRESGFPASKLVLTEALRYSKLEATQIVSKLKSTEFNESLRILVMGDYLAKNTHLQLKLLEGTIPKLTFPTTITFKPHPACPVNSDDYPTLEIEVTSESLSNLLLSCDVAFSSAATSAAVDSYVVGVPVISALNPNELNMSPLRGYQNVLYASNEDELAHSFELIRNRAKLENMEHVKFYTFDPDIPRWNALLHLAK